MRKEKEGIAVTSKEPQTHSRFLLTIDDLRGGQADKLKIFIAGSDKINYLGGVTYSYSVHAIRTDDGIIELWKTPYDYEGRWFKAKIRNWNLKFQYRQI